MKVGKAVTKYLQTIKYGLNLDAKDGTERGVDIRVRHNTSWKYFLVEIKECNSTKQSSQRKTFENALGQIICRMNVKKKSLPAYQYGIGFPEQVAKIAIRSIPPEIAKRLRLHVFSVDKKGKVTDYDWKKIEEEKANKNA